MYPYFLWQSGDKGFTNPNQWYSAALVLSLLKSCLPYSYVIVRTQHKFFGFGFDDIFHKALDLI